MRRSADQRGPRSLVLGLVTALVAAWPAFRAVAQEGVLPQEGYIAGVVRSASGPEAGVWVIAETDDLPTKLTKIVVTDDEGRFVLPQLPMVNYHVWVRGYGLRDSKKQYLRPGDHNVVLEVEPAATPAEAAKVYPADYWLSLREPPKEEEFPAAGGSGRGLAVQSQAQWIDVLKLGCNFCHQIGNAATRSFDHWSDEFKAQEGLTNATSVQLWERRLRTGPRGTEMYARLGWMGPERSLEVFADWTDRIAAGELPPAPPRPQGMERNT